MDLDARLTHIAATTPDAFTADDLTDNGHLTVDPDHKPNARQNAIGSFMRHAAASGLIEKTGGVIKSKSPTRKGGMIQVWRMTDKGKRRAASRLPL